VGDDKGAAHGAPDDAVDFVHDVAFEDTFFMT
jgi:hypothetical protein